MTSVSRRTVLVGLWLVLSCDPVEIELFRKSISLSSDAGQPATQASAPDAALDAAPSTDIVVPEPRDAGSPIVDAGPVLPPECLLCAANTPLCELASATCVECLSDSDCLGLRGSCDVGDSWTCNECVSDEQCSGNEECIREPNEPEEGLHCED